MRRRRAVDDPQGCPDRTGALLAAWDRLVAPGVDLDAAAWVVDDLVRQCQRRCPEGLCGTCGRVVVESHKLRLSLGGEGAVESALIRARP